MALPRSAGSAGLDRSDSLSRYSSQLRDTPDLARGRDIGPWVEQGDAKPPLLVLANRASSKIAMEMAHLTNVLDLIQEGTWA
jgi:hypothetical protein